MVLTVSTTSFFFFFPPPVFESVKLSLGFMSLAGNSLGKTDLLFILLAELDVFQPPHTKKSDAEANYSKTWVGIPFWEITFLS